MKIVDSDRKKLFILMFQRAFYNFAQVKEQIDIYIENQDEEETRKEDVFIEKDEEVIEKFEAIVQRSREIDEIISRNLQKWDIMRIGKVELAILRLATFEIRLNDEEIEISEIVGPYLKICGKYAQKENRRFLNGVLKNITLEMKK